MENTKTCGLCREQISNDNFERLDFAKIRSLKTLINLDTTINQQAAICSKCADVCQELYNFKNACLRNGDYLKTFTRLTDESKLILEDVIVKTTKSEVKCEEERVCQFCLNYFEVNSLVEINGEKDVTLKNMIGRCLPEINTSIVENPLICYMCSELLQKLSSFISQCDNAEVLKNLDTKTNVFLNENTTVSIEDDSNINTSIVKKEEIFEDIENLEVHVKSEDFDIDEDVKDSVNNGCKIWGCEEDAEKLDNLKCNICTFSASNKRDIVRHNRTCHKDRKQVKYSCGVCYHQTNKKSSLKLHYRVHQDLTEEGKFKCYMCSYVTKGKGKLVKHYKRWHKDISNLPRQKCDECPYETIWSWELVSHKIKHTNPLEVKMYKCTECSYKTKHKSLLQKHKTMHARNGENAMKTSDKTKERKFVCDVCPYQADKNARLKRHYLIHKEPSEVNIFKCDYCPFVTKWKSGLTLHAVCHRNPSELPKYKCTHCPYETNRRQSLVAHFLVHKHRSEVAMFKCKVCPYETRYKRYIRIHEKRHEVDIYKCDKCNYETKFKNSLTVHVRYHKEWKQPANQNLKGVGQYKCNECSYVGMRKSILTKHQLLHKDPSERNMYCCKECSYEALYKTSIKKHYKKNHPNLEIPLIEPKTFLCNECEFETSYKKDILNHLQAHEQEKRTIEVKEELRGQDNTECKDGT